MVCVEVLRKKLSVDKPWVTVAFSSCPLNNVWLSTVAEPITFIKLSIAIALVHTRDMAMKINKNMVFDKFRAQRY